MRNLKSSPSIILQWTGFLCAQAYTIIRNTVMHKRIGVESQLYFMCVCVTGVITPEYFHYLMLNSQNE